MKRIIFGHFFLPGKLHYRQYYWHADPTMMFYPRITLLRVVLSAGGMAAGYVSYRIQEGREWVNRQLETVNDALWNIFSAKSTIAWHQPETKDVDADNGIPLSPSSSSPVPGGRGTEFTGFVRRMIEVDALLRHRQDDTNLSVALPKIVVIGSQSSGKSSVLEALVGHSFLPKGTNMVTRRPLLLTLVNDPSAVSDYAIFPLLTGEVRVDDFYKVAERVHEANLAVPEGEWISEVPVEVRIHSQRLPDLTLVDLPGYIAVNNRRQPAILRERIQAVCDGFLGEPNIILAVSAADVDLANSEALQAARRHDPAGIRTIGVLTKLDLVTADGGAGLLRNNADYPLNLGYVGVVVGHAIADKDYFSMNASIYRDTQHGMAALQRILVHTLEASLRSHLGSILTRVQDELAEVRYELKAHYSDRTLTADGYLAEVVGRVREGVDRLAQSFSKAAVRTLLKQQLFDRHYLEVVMDNCLDCVDNSLQSGDLHSLVLQLTRAGWGRKCAHVLADDILRSIRSDILEAEPLRHHPGAAAALMTAIESTCRSRIAAAADQIENALKPYKQPDSIEYDMTEWQLARQSLLVLMDSEIKATHRQAADITAGQLGGDARTRRIIERLAGGEPVPGNDQRSVDLLIRLWQREQQLVKLQNGILRNKTCSSPVPTMSMFSRLFGRSVQDTSISESSSAQLSCPAVYLYLVCRRLASTSALYAQDELAPDSQRLRLPDLLLDRHRQDPLGFAKENVAVFRHLDLLSRQSLLESVRERLFYLCQGGASVDSR